MVKHLLSAVTALCLGASVQAQTVSDFENVAIPANSVVHSDIYPTPSADSAFSFDAGNARFWGKKASWGGWSHFNVSKLDSVTYDFPNNMNSNITGSGYNGSNNFVTCYIEQDWMSGTYDMIPVGVSLQNNAIGGKVAGFYTTNSSYTYGYVLDNADFRVDGYMHIIVRGYNNGVVKPDSVIHKLVEFRNGDSIAINNWEWVDLTSLGDVDSLTFSVATNDLMAPTYIVLDNFVTLDGNAGCTDTFTVNTEGNFPLATVTWNYPASDSFEVVINQSNAVNQGDVINTISNAQTYSQNTGLIAGNTYYAHVRAFCPYSSTFTSWNVDSFIVGPGSSIKRVNQIQAKIYPNPAQNVLHFEYTEPLNVMVVDINGKVVLESKAVNQIQVQSLVSGNYFIRLEDKKGQKSVYPFTKL